MDVIAVVAVLMAGSLIAGVIITLRHMGGRPIVVNVTNHAEAHGGSSPNAGATSQAAGVNSGGGIGKWLKIAAAVGLALFAVSTIGQIRAMNTPAPPIIVNVPTQAPVEQPKIVAPPITSIPQQAPVVVSPTSGGDVSTLLMVAAFLITIIIVCFFIYIRLQRKPTQPKPATTFVPTKYVRTDYGWSPIEYHPDALDEQIERESVIVKRQSIIEDFFRNSRLSG